jgi:hypothetical protein
MGFLSIIFGDKEGTKFANSWLEVYRSNYFKSIKRYPNAPTVFHLFQQWSAFFEIKQKEKPYLLTLETRKLASCIHACIPHPECCEAMALCMLSIEHPRVIAKNPEYEMAYGNYMAKIYNLIQNDNFDALNAIYDRLNPSAKEKSPFPIGGTEAWQRARQFFFRTNNGANL